MRLDLAKQRNTRTGQNLVSWRSRDKTGWYPWWVGADCVAQQGI